MNNTVLKMIGISLVMLTMVACTPHPGGELVEKGVLQTEVKDSDDFKVKNVWVHADEEGTHIHGKLQRRGYGAETEHVEITLLDKDGNILYMGTMKPSRWHVNPRYQTGSVRDETFHVVTQAPVPEKGLVRVVYHPGPEHEPKQP